MTRITVHLMKVLHYRIGVKTIPKRPTFRKQTLDKKLSLRSDTFKSIFIAKNTCICITHIVYLLSMYSHMHNTYCLFDFHFYLQIFTGDCFSILLELSVVFGPVWKSSDTPGIKASWRRRNDISLYVPTTSQVRPKWNPQRLLDGTSPKRLSGTSPPCLIGTS